ncbi:MAG TPA: hypothetical protein VFU47_14355 [Armatimonadota bacterium]|nr:hypothetical protein [Armatimonadota bacterium]
MITTGDIRPGHRNYWWTAGTRELYVDENGFVVREPDGTLEFVCEGCGVKVSGPTSEVRAIAAFHMTTDPTDYTKGIFT